MEIILLARKYSNSFIATRLGISIKTVRKWRKRWHDAASVLAATERDGWTERQLTALISTVLSDAPRSGAPGKATSRRRGCPWRKESPGCTRQ
nr:helix-turn-helix domain-containing protein [Candidatus Sigynarchaeum springense]